MNKVYISTAEETEAATEVVLDAFTLQHFNWINNLIRLMFYIFFLNIQINVEKNAMILLNMTKPYGGGKCLF